MSNLITLDNVSLAFGLDVLLDRIKLTIAPEERVCLIGRNGAGKSSLLKIMEGVQAPDSGTVAKKPQLRVARLTQELPQNMEMSVFDYVAEGLLEVGQLLSAYHHLTLKLQDTHTGKDMQQLEELQRQIDAKEGWAFEQNMKTVLTRLSLSPDWLIGSLSGGWQRRAALAKALVANPELLLLDEPTNHLDIAAIQWLEETLIDLKIGIIFVTHDRALLKRLATRIIELDRGHLTSWPGDYDNFLRRKAEMLHAEEVQNAEFDKKLAAEERWIRQGIKARRTRNEGRVRALEALRVERKKRRDVQGKVSLNIDDAKKSGQLVIEAKDITHFFNEKCVIKDFSIRIMRGDRIGLIGPNGVGKSTLLNILLQKYPPDKGHVSLGSQLSVAYFDQMRLLLDPEKTVIDNVSEGADTIEINGGKQHIMGYLNNFLFTRQRAMTKVKALSGGECNRLLLARLFSKPFNLLVLDEPTNDLDIETLELLEDLISDYQGTLLIVSHDRAFLDNVVTSSLYFEGEGIITEHVGSFHPVKRDNIPSIDVVAKEKKTKVKAQDVEKKELAKLMIRIQKLETAQADLLEEMGSPQFYEKDAETIKLFTKNLQQLEDDLKDAYERWEQLEN
jgi:ATP-binding cassette subfamily F protein uup